MGIFSRLGTLIKSNLNDLISKAEDPEKMLNQVLNDMKGQLVEAKKQVAVAIGDEKRLTRSASFQRWKWSHRAGGAITKTKYTEQKIQGRPAAVMATK